MNCFRFQWVINTVVKNTFKVWWIYALTSHGCVPRHGRLSHSVSLRLVLVDTMKQFSETGNIFTLHRPRITFPLAVDPFPIVAIVRLFIISILVDPEGVLLKFTSP